jgi:hypothetical protein
MLEYSHKPEDEYDTEVGYVLQFESFQPDRLETVQSSIENTFPNAEELENLEEINGPRRISYGYHIEEFPVLTDISNLKSVSIWMIESRNFLVELIFVGEVDMSAHSGRINSEIHTYANKMRNTIRDDILPFADDSFQTLVMVAPDEKFYTGEPTLENLRSQLKMGPSREYLGRFTSGYYDVEIPIGIFEDAFVLCRLSESFSKCIDNERRYVAIGVSSAASPVQLLDIHNYNPPFEWLYLSELFAIEKWLDVTEPRLDKFQEQLSDISAELPTQDDGFKSNKLSSLSNDVFNLQYQWTEQVSKFDLGHEECRDRISGRKFDIESTPVGGISHYGAKGRFDQSTSGYFEQYIDELNHRLTKFRTKMEWVERVLKNSSEYFSQQTLALANSQSIDLQKNVEYLTRVIAVLTVIVVGDILFSWLPQSQLSPSDQLGGILVIAYAMIVCVVIIMSG